MKDKKPLDWIPLYIDKHLFGSTRLEFEPDERSVWTDLLALAGKDKGFIRANEGCPYQPAQLAGMLVIPLELYERTIAKCSSKEIGKIEILPDGTMYLPSWPEYKLSDRHKRRFEENEEAKFSAEIKTPYKINDEIRSAVNYSLKKLSDGNLWEKLLGYTRRDLADHLEILFKDGMSWENHGEWHIDHIKRLTESTYTTFLQSTEIREFWGLHNLRPLWARDNLKRPKKSPEKDNMSPERDTLRSTADTIERDRERDRDIDIVIKELEAVKGFPQKTEITADFIIKLRAEYPDLDPLEQIRKKIAWWISNPLKKKSNPYVQLRNWFRLGSEYLKESNQNLKIGQAAPKQKTEKEKSFNELYMAKRKELFEEKYKDKMFAAQKEGDLYKLEELENQAKEELAAWTEENLDE